MPNIQLLFGPMLIGVFMNMILYGVLIMQTLTYYQTYKHDAPWIRYLVLYLFLIETLNTGIDISIMYQPLILEYGLPKATTFFPTMFPFQPISVVAVSTPIQLFFAWRIWLLTRSPWVPILIALFAVTSLAGGIWTATMVAILQLFSKKPQLHVPALVWFLAACAADVLITINLVLTLTKKKTGFVATDDAISKIIRMTVQTGMLTALFAIGDVVFFMTLPHTALNFVWDIALSKLYTNCLMSSLNARAGLNEVTSGGIGIAGGVRAGRRSGSGSGSGSGIGSGMGIGTGFGLGGARRMDIGGPLNSTHQQAAFELESHIKSYTDERSSSGSTRGDLEYGIGITVTKVVQRLEDDPEFGLSPTSAPTPTGFDSMTQ